MKENQLDFLPPLSKIEQVDFNKIRRDFVKPKKTPKNQFDYKKPRIVFLGKFEFLSLTDQRYLCSSLEFEDFQNLVPFVSESNDNISGSLLDKWKNIDEYKFTRLVVIGSYSTESIKTDLDKARKITKQDKFYEPNVLKYNIPVILESELIKIHPDYPKINKSTLWKNIIPIV
jgi:hypothetical protein